MMTTGSTRGKCWAEHSGQRRDQPPRSISVEAPQLAQKRCRECHQARLRAAAKSGASSRARPPIVSNAARAFACGCSVAENRGWPSWMPRNRSVAEACCHSSRPSSPTAGRPSRQTSWRAPVPVSSARRSGIDAYLVGAVDSRSRKEGLRPQARSSMTGPTRPLAGRGSADQPRRDRRAAATSPRQRERARTGRPQLQPEMREHMRDPTEHRPALRARRSIPVRASAAIPPSMPLAGRRTSQTQPFRSIQ